MAGNIFTEYQTKSSLRKRYGRYVQGGDTEAGAEKIRWWERDVTISELNNDDIIIDALPNSYHRRPDLLAHDLYERADLMWVILQFNSIIDIHEEFVAGMSIRVPSRGRVFTDILTKRVDFR